MSAPIESSPELASASIDDLLTTYAAFIADARLLEERGHIDAAKLAAANAYTIAAEVERRATPIAEVCS